MLSELTVFRFFAVVSQFPKAYCFGACFMAHAAKFLTERWILGTPWAYHFGRTLLTVLPPILLVIVIFPGPWCNCTAYWHCAALHGLLALCSTAPVVDQSLPCVLAPVTYMASYLLVACEVCCVAGAGSLSPTNGLGGLWISCWWAKNGPISFVFRMAAFCWL
jgi:hypothetical protein